MKYDAWYRARGIVEDFLKKDLLGPATEFEIIEDEPLRYYTLGKLFPQENEVDVAEVREVVIDGVKEDVGESFDACVSLSNTYNPSSMAVTFTLSPYAGKIKVLVNAARYEPIEEKIYYGKIEAKGDGDGVEDAKDKKEQQEKEQDKEKFILDYKWKRVPIQKELSFFIEKQAGIIKKEEIAEGLEGRLYIHKIFSDGAVSATFAVVNTNKSNTSLHVNNQKSFFQVEVSLESEKPSEEIFIEKRMNAGNERDYELLMFDMLYSHVRNYAVGHGCSVEWTDGAKGAVKLVTRFLPEYELFQMKPATRLDSQVFKMEFLASADKKEIVNELQKLIASYDEWIKEQEEASSSMQEPYIGIASDNIEKCHETKKRILSCVQMLEQDDDVMKSFQLANKAMLLQRKQVLEKEGRKFEQDKIYWYPFQIAFILQEIPSIVKNDDNYRNIVDLLWFPTGGGKTEAYLGLSAFTLFYRRLRDGENGGGVAILMRYTLRLLTLQQFERAAILICACEKIRKDEKMQGGEIGIGLWVGGGLTPNNLKSAEENLKKVQAHEDVKEGNPCQILVCPWCGASIGPNCYSTTKGCLSIICPNGKCDFHSGLPLWLVDEDIYAKKPSLVVGTVDKFARMAWEPQVGQIFGIGTRHNPPELVIQDELHLISGPLGTIAGLYEMAVRKFCEKNGVSSKIVASTATIRKADSQVAALYGMPVRQFPAQGINIRDSYFAEESKRDDRPARKYVGVMAPGTSATTTLVRVYACLLFASRYLKDCGFEDEVVDSFWTMTGYFNSLRELGGAVVQVLDDVQDRFEYLYTTKFKDITPQFSSRYRHDWYDELTSRKSNSEISEIIQKSLKVKFHEGRAYDFILASNMISVGVDVGRLGVMAVTGQPKTNAEYIQASSRVGRENPGLVVTMYNASRSRDKSHYEQFLNYHSSIYRFVEATSVTPFSDRARDRGFHAVYISLCRQLIAELRENDAASEFDASMESLMKIEQYISDYIKKADPEELDNVLRDIEEVKREWKSVLSDDLVYAGKKGSSIPLLKSDGNGAGAFETPNSMRSVDAYSNVFIMEE